MLAVCPWCSKAHAQWGVPGANLVGEAIMCFECGRWCVITEAAVIGPQRPRRADADERKRCRSIPAGIKLRKAFLATGRKPSRKRV